MNQIKTKRLIVERILKQDSGKITVANILSYLVDHTQQFTDLDLVNKKWVLDQIIDVNSQGAMVISAELILTSQTQGTISAEWIDFESQNEIVTNQNLGFNGTGLPATGNYRFDIVQGNNVGVVTVKQGIEGNATGVVIPSPDSNNLILTVILWDSAGAPEVIPPSDPNLLQNDFSTIRLSTAVTANSTGLFAKIFETELSSAGSYSIIIGYAEPKNGVNFDGSGAQELRLSFTADTSRVIIAQTVQAVTSQGSVAGEFVLYQLAGNRVSIYHKSNHFWGRIQFRVVFQSSQVALSDFVNNDDYAVAPTVLATYNSNVEGSGSGGQEIVEFSTIINMSGNFKSRHIQTGQIAYTKGSFNTPLISFGNETRHYVTANGTGGQPTFSSDFVLQMNTWSNNIGDINQIIHQGSPSGKILVWVDNVELA